MDNEVTEYNNKHIWKEVFIFWIIAGIVLFLDQFTKYIIISSIGYGQQIVVIPGFFNIVHATNTGGAFGILANAGKWKHLFFQVVSVAAIIGLFYFYISSKNRTKLFLIGSALIAGGAMGNLTDRIRLRAVTDFLDFHIGVYHWPAFNIADSAITIGALLLMIHFFSINS